MSSKLIALVLLLHGAPVAAEPAGPPPPVTEKHSAAEQAIALYKAEHGPRTLVTPCSAGQNGEIVVCGQRDAVSSPYRVPLPDERGPRDWARRPTGEVPSASAALAATDIHCGGLGCGGENQVDLIAIARTVGKLAGKLVDPDR